MPRKVTATEQIKVGDKLHIVADGREHIMVVFNIYPPGEGGKSFASGPTIHAWIEPGGYGKAFDNSHLANGSVLAEIIDLACCTVKYVGRHYYQEVMSSQCSQWQTVYRVVITPLTSKSSHTCRVWLIRKVRE